MKKGVLENLAKFTGKLLQFAKSTGTPFLQNTSATASLLKWGTANSVWKTLTLEVPFRYLISFSAA